MCADGSPLRILNRIVRDDPSKMLIIPIPGAGHEEMNMLRAFNSLVWPLWGDEFAESHGFSTERQKKLIEEVWDMHKGADAHKILLEGLFRELVYHFLQMSEGEKTVRISAIVGSVQTQHSRSGNEQ